MYMKNANTIIADDIKDIPFKELKIGTQIIQFKNNYNDELEIDINTTTNMILSEIINNNLYIFACVKSTPYIYTKEVLNFDDSSDIVYRYEANSALYDVEEFKIGYIIAENLCIPFIPKSKDGNSDYEEFFLDEEEFIYKFFKHIRDIQTNKFNRYAKYSTYSQENTLYNYLLIPISNETSLVLTFISEVKTRTWNVDEGIYLITDNDKIVEVNLNMKINNILPYLDKIGLRGLENEIKKFKDEVVDIIEFDTYDYLKSNSSKRHNTINKLSRLLLHSKSTIFDAAMFFEPIYENKDLDFKAYLDTIRGYSHNAKCVITKDGEQKILYSYDLDKSSNNSLYSEIRKAQAIHDWIVSNKSGISPYDGDLYYKGEKPGEFIYTKIIYRTHECIWALINSRNVFFILIDGYYVRADEENENDKIMIEEMKENKTMVDKLSTKA